jgi:hydrogenase nickel incorporation protein HypA/HybF
MSILDLAAEEMSRQGAGRVCAIHLRLGPLSGVVATSLRSAFELAREGSEFETAELKIEEVPLRTRCDRCGDERILTTPEIPACARCESPAVAIIQGRELDLVALEIDS